MKLIVEIDFEDCLKACLDYAERKMRLFSEIIGKKIDKKELISIVRASSDEEKAKSVMVEEYDLTEDEVTLLLDMTMSDIAENKQDWLDYYRTSVNALSRLVRDKEETDNNTSYIELVTH